MGPALEECGPPSRAPERKCSGGPMRSDCETTAQSSLLGGQSHTCEPLGLPHPALLCHPRLGKWCQRLTGPRPQPQPRRGLSENSHDPVSARRGWAGRCLPPSGVGRGGISSRALRHCVESARGVSTQRSPASPEGGSPRCGLPAPWERERSRHCANQRAQPFAPRRVPGFASICQRAPPHDSRREGWFLCESGSPVTSLTRLRES